MIRNITTSVRKQASVHSYSRKSSKASSDEEDTIALTSRATKTESVHSRVDDDPWSPTVTYGQANVQRVVVSIQGGSPKVSRAR